MVSRQRSDDSDSPRRPPGKTPEARENQLIALAYDLAEQQLREGTASSQVITHWMKAGSRRERLEQARLAEEVSLLKIRSEAIESQKRVEEMYSEAMTAFRAYSGQEPEEGDERYDD
jgi:hypothetical protein